MHAIRQDKRVWKLQQVLKPIPVEIYFNEIINHKCMSIALIVSCKVKEVGNVHCAIAFIALS